MSNPATKYLKVISGHEVNLSPKGIVVQCSGGTVKIEVLKSGKINLYAQNEIQITTQNEMMLQTKRIMRISAEKTICLESSVGGSLTMDEEGNIIIKGHEVHVN